MAIRSENIAAAQAIAKYAVVVIDHFSLLRVRAGAAPEYLYRSAEPIQVQPGIYEINSPKPDSPC